MELCPPLTRTGQKSLLLAGDLAIYISTKQGSVKGLRDDGSGLPAVEWTYSPVGP